MGGVLREVEIEMLVRPLDGLMPVVNPDFTKDII
jgi:hypothetical protein